MNLLSGLSEFSDWGLLALRLGVGIIFLVHGKMKLAMWGMEPSEQMPAQMISLMKLLSVVELLGGLALILGFLTQFASLGLGIIMIGAINMKIRTMKVAFFAQDNTGWEFDFILLASCLFLVLNGAGSIGLDRLLLGI